MNLRYIFIYLLGLLILDIPIFAKVQFNISSNNNSQNSKLSLSNKKKDIVNIFKNDFNDLYKNLGIFLVQDVSNEQDVAFDIESDIQFQNGNIFVAEGNVIMQFSDGKLLADEIIYDTLNKNFEAKGNVLFKKGSQFFEADEIYYELENKKGFVNNVYGVIVLDKFSQDINLENSLDDVNKFQIENFDQDINDLNYMKSINIGLTNDADSDEGRKFNITDVKFDIPKISKWRFKSKRIEIGLNKFETDKIIFTNDAFNKPQFLLESNNFSGEIINEKIKFISRNTWINFDQKLKLPIGRRTIFDRDPLTKWWVGSDYSEKDGFYFARDFDEIKLFDNFSLRLTPYFLIQRAIKGKTNSFTKEGSSLFSSKVTNETSLLDYFALDSLIEGKISSWDLNLTTNLNTLNENRIHDAIRSKLTLSKSFEITPKNNKDYQSNLNNEILNNEIIESKFENFIDIKFSSAFRQQVDKGIDGTAEIYFAKNISVANRRLFSKNDVNANLYFVYDLGEIKAEKKNIKEFNTLTRNVFAAKFSYDFPLIQKKLSSQNISEEYLYSPEVIKEGIIWKTNLNGGLFLYSDDSSQESISIHTGPEITYGSFKSKILDYSKIKITGSQFLKSGQSPFKFDDINDSPRVKIELNQQVYVALVFNYETHLNLDDGKFKSPKYGLDFRRRAYSLGAFYSPESEEFGFKFQIFNFDYSGLSPRF